MPLPTVAIVVWEAAAAQEALDALREHPSIGLLFTDVELPGSMDGLELARRVRETCQDVHVIVTSGAVKLRDEDLPDHGIFLCKPYAPARLVDLVTEKLSELS
jgi:CheY-like chemotaxis protein